MVRLGLALASVALYICAAAAQSPYGNNPGVAPPVPAPAQPSVPRLLGGAPAAPAFAPGAAAPAPTLVPRPVGPPVEIPGHKPGDSFGDRVSRCIHYGSAQGVPPSQIGQFSAQCAN